MIKWLKNRTKQEKWMLALIAALLIGIVVRWGFVKQEVWDAFKSRIEHFKAPEVQDSVRMETGPVEWSEEIVRDTMEL